MSTNKTPNYDLHSWEPTDDFLLTEINENFTALDAAIKSEAEALDTALKTEAESLTASIASLAEAVGQKVEAVTGRYVGNGAAEQVIDLGRKPFAVIVEKYGGFRQTGIIVYGGLATRDLPLSGAARISDTGFTVVYKSDLYYMNENNTNYGYIAFFA